MRKACHQLKKVTLGNGITTISKATFADCLKILR